MLQELRVKNYALLDHVVVHFDDGFTALTGETGAGKSLLVNALGLILGEKAQTQDIRYGEEEAEVIGIIRVTDQSTVRSLLQDNDIALDENILELRRVVRQKGSSSIYANGVRITREQLQAISRLIFDMHGQHEHQSLYNQDNQRIILDRVAKIQDKVTEFQSQFLLLRKKKEELRLFKEEQNKLIEEMLYREKALEEISELNPSLEEKQYLQQRALQLEDGERLQESLQQFSSLMKGQSGLIVGLKEARHLLNHLDEHIDAELVERLEGAILEIEDVNESLHQWQDRLLGSPQELESVHAKLMEYQRLEKKYGLGTLEGLLLFYNDANDLQKKQESAESTQKELEESIGVTEQYLRKEAQIITQEREESARKLELEMAELLVALSLPHAQLSVEISPRKNSANERVIGATGADEVRFLFSANPGEPLKPLREVASGGESSRILLILKSVLSQQEEVGCLIFDEIDTGIGGEVALQVARHMRKLSTTKQVICITHLASMAAAAKTQLKIEKNSVDNQTRTTITEVRSEQRVEEIARMLSGSIDERALEHARALLNLDDGAGEDHGKKECSKS